MDSGNGLLGSFLAYVAPTDEEHIAALRTGLVVVDTNVLLNVYRYHEEAREDLFATFEALQGRLFIPHQVAVEFWKNRDATIREASGAAAELKNELNGLANRSAQSLATWAKRTGLTPTRLKEIQVMLDLAYQQVLSQVETFSESGIEPAAIDTNHDPVLTRLITVAEGRVGSPYDEVELKAHVHEAQRRIEVRHPPGYEDAGKSGAGQYGDYMLWRQILDAAKTASRDVVLVTGDLKEDWWRREKGQTRGPRIELFEELKRETGQRLFMLRPAGLLERAKNALSLEIRQDSVEVAERIDRSSFDQQRRHYRGATDLYPVMKLPDGRKGDYLETVIQMTELARDEPSYEEFLELFQDTFPSISVTSEARRRVGILASLDLVSFAEDRVQLTEMGHRLLEERTLQILQNQFMSRIAGAKEVLSKALTIPRNELKHQLRDEPLDSLSPTQAGLILRWIERLELV